MTRKKESKAFYISCEGECEIYYFEYLQDLINSSLTSKFNCRIIARKKNPLSFMRTNYNLAGKVRFFHAQDIESTGSYHLQKFYNLIDEIDSVNKSFLAKAKYKYVLGYSNFSFELWMILHKRPFNVQVGHRKNYLTPLNASYGKSFAHIDDYKHETVFKNEILKQISLNDIKQAVKNADVIVLSNCHNKKPHQYRFFKFFLAEPDLTIHDVVRTILLECEA